MKTLAFLTIFFLFSLQSSFGGEIITLEVKVRLKSTVVTQDGNGNLVSIVRTCIGSRGTCFVVQFEIVDETIQNFCRTAGYDSTNLVEATEPLFFESPSKIKVSKKYREVSTGLWISDWEYNLLSLEDKEEIEVVYTLVDWNAIN
jgi:hypothetical protein